MRQSRNISCKLLYFEQISWKIILKLVIFFLANDPVIIRQIKRKRSETLLVNKLALTIVALLLLVYRWVTEDCCLFGCRIRLLFVIVAGINIRTPIISILLVWGVPILVGLYLNIRNRICSFGPIHKHFLIRLKVLASVIVILRILHGTLDWILEQGGRQLVIGVELEGVEDVAGENHVGVQVDQGLFWGETWCLNRWLYGAYLFLI